MHENRHAGKITTMVGATDRDEGQELEAARRDLG